MGSWWFQAKPIKKPRSCGAFAKADLIRKTLLDQGVVLEDKPGGLTEWRRD
jgi:cysteinyl-tRNA synthetase